MSSLSKCYPAGGGLVHQGLMATMVGVVNPQGMQSLTAQYKRNGAWNPCFGNNYALQAWNGYDRLVFLGTGTNSYVPGDATTVQINVSGTATYSVYYSNYIYNDGYYTGDGGFLRAVSCTTLRLLSHRELEAAGVMLAEGEVGILVELTSPNVPDTRSELVVRDLRIETYAAGEELFSQSVANARTCAGGALNVELLPSQKTREIYSDGVKRGESGPIFSTGGVARFLAIAPSLTGARQIGVVSGKLGLASEPDRVLESFCYQDELVPACGGYLQA